MPLTHSVHIAAHCRTLPHSQCTHCRASLKCLVLLCIAVHCSASLKVLCIDLPSQRLPSSCSAVHCAAVNSSWTRIARRRCRVSGRHCCCLPACLRLGAPGGAPVTKQELTTLRGQVFTAAASFFFDKLIAGRHDGLQQKILEMDFISSILF